MRTKAIVVATVTRLGQGYGFCDVVEGFFTRAPGFTFELYLNDVQSDETYRNTRICEMYIKLDSTPPITQWSWNNFDRQKLEWAFGEKLVADLCAGIETAIKKRIPQNTEYCTIRIHSLLDQLLKTGIERKIVEAATKKVLEQALRAGA